MRCMDCPLNSIGQTDRKLQTRYKEHIQAIRSKNSNSEYSNHKLNTGHAYGSITDTMKVIWVEKKGRYLNTIYIYTVFIVQAYQTCQYVVPRGGIFLDKWQSSFEGSSDGRMNVQSACALNTRYKMSKDGVHTNKICARRLLLHKQNSYIYLERKRSIWTKY
jgi:hypothetical protein